MSLLLKDKIFIPRKSGECMAQDNKLQMPGVFGGLQRFDEEYTSRFLLSPMQVIAYVVAIIVLVLILKSFFPIG
jgi:preprotein translocase subunit Sec61beta